MSDPAKVAASLTEALPGFRDLTYDELVALRLSGQPRPVPAGLSRCTAVEYNQNGKAFYCGRIVISDQEALRAHLQETADHD